MTSKAKQNNKQTVIKPTMPRERENLRIRESELEHLHNFLPLNYEKYS